MNLVGAADGIVDGVVGEGRVVADKRAVALAAGGGGAASPAVFSTENREIVCSFPLSKSWKSSFLRLPIAWPLPSRTTTGTVTSSTWVLKVGCFEASPPSRTVLGWPPPFQLGVG